MTSPPTPASSSKDLGLSLAPAVKFPGAGEEGVVITEVDPNSDAADKGLKAGDVILQVAGETVSQPGDVAKGVKKAMDKRQGQGQGQRPDSGQNRRSDALRCAFPEEG